MAVCVVGYYWCHGQLDLPKTSAQPSVLHTNQDSSIENEDSSIANDDSATGNDDSSIEQ